MSAWLAALGVGGTASDTQLVEYAQLGCRQRGVRHECYFNALARLAGRGGAPLAGAAVAEFQAACQRGLSIAACVRWEAESQRVRARDTGIDREVRRWLERDTLQASIEGASGLWSLTLEREPGDHIVAIGHCIAGQYDACEAAGNVWMRAKPAGFSRMLGQLLLKRALEGYQQACRSSWNATVPCYRLARVWESSASETSEHVSVLNHYRRACDRGLVDGCVGLVRVARRWRQKSVGKREVRSALERACLGFHATGCLEYGRLLLKKRPKKARRMLTWGCVLGEADACDEALALGGAPGDMKIPDERLRSYGKVWRDFPGVECLKSPMCATGLFDR